MAKGLTVEELIRQLSEIKNPELQVITVTLQNGTEFVVELTKWTMANEPGFLKIEGFVQRVRTTAPIHGKFPP